MFMVYVDTKSKTKSKPINYDSTRTKFKLSQTQNRYERFTFRFDCDNQCWCDECDFFHVHSE